MTTLPNHTIDSTHPSETANQSPPKQPTPRGALLAELVENNKLLVKRYLVGFNDVTHVRCTPDLPNHVSWTLGHIAITMYRAAATIDGNTTIPDTDFKSMPTKNGSREHGFFDLDQVAFGSKPEERHDRYPSLERSTTIFEHAVDRLAQCCRSATDEQLDKQVTYGPVGVTMPAYILISRMMFHNGFHTGQIADLRRALGFKSIFA